jgi:transposase
MLTDGVVLIHDNARLHTAAHTRALLEHFNLELFDHPPYSPDLILSDYHTFTYMKNWL